MGISMDISMDPWIFPWISTKKSVDMGVDMDGKFHIHGKPGSVNVMLDMILGIEDILISWFVIILALLGGALLFVCCVICKPLR